MPVSLLRKQKCNADVALRATTRNASVRVEDQGPRDLDGVFCDGASEPHLVGGG